MLDHLTQPDEVLLSQDRVAARWYVVCTHPHKEATALGHLERQGFLGFLPQIRKVVRGQRRVQQVLRPLFPRYLFVSLDLDSQGWRKVRHTVGVSSLVMEGERPKPVPRGLVEELVCRTTAGDGVSVASGVAVGERVQFVGGPLAERIGQLIAMKDTERAIVLLSMLGSEREVAVGVAHLQRAELAR
jgi:transcriptional antiterminator RfaH